METTTGNHTATLDRSRAYNLWRKHQKSISRHQSGFDMTDENEFKSHTALVKSIGNNYMGREFRDFEVDENNRLLMRFLLYYFHGCHLATEVYPNQGFTSYKNLLLLGEPGTGKTMIMQVYADYLKLLGINTAYHNISVTQMMNYYKQHGHIDRYTYNEEGANKSFDGNPLHVCLNDIGLETEAQKSYGTSLTSVIDEFLFARYEIYQHRMIHYHLTSNLTVAEIKHRFENRLVDRFKSFNVIPLTGGSRRK